MSTAPILLVGGSGHVGRWTARSLRQAHPDIPLLLGGRNLANAQRVAEKMGGAEGVVLDLSAQDLGLGHREVSAVAVLLSDEHRGALHFAQSRRIPHLSVSLGINEIAPEVAAYMRQPEAAPVVLGTEWLVGATSIPTLEFARAFSRIHDITIGALLDEHDAAGPAATDDWERQTQTLPAALVRRDGAYVWRMGDEIKTSFRALDGTEMEATAYSPYDVVGLATATGAPNVQFHVAMGVSSSRRRGEAFSTEILIELSGEDQDGRPLRTRHAVVHPEGQMPLTGLGVAMTLERLLGLDGGPVTPAGLYFPHQLLHPAAYWPRFEQSGGQILELNVD
ncbi:hypothetical protein [Deinococcus sp. Leaf326]|uniref:hypothetical protein n=1 Tax=Deinococcus sp. Leaf326 TaxID=1736338 RepID=UPI0006FEA596|nr:hypothetical protein [Deinococcus sp. Leaf326]KQR25705.1 saccharopine dehydrogenase [Deinococcus sp. Leaf326]